MYSFSFYYDKTNHAILIVNKNSLLYSKLSSIVFNLKMLSFTLWIVFISAFVVDVFNIYL